VNYVNADHCLGTSQNISHNLNHLMPKLLYVDEDFFVKSDILYQEVHIIRFDSSNHFYFSAPLQFHIHLFIRSF
jgi:hypothetical protein